MLKGSAKVNFKRHMTLRSLQVHDDRAEVWPTIQDQIVQKC
jgi:hypothetical protein